MKDKSKRRERDDDEPRKKRADDSDAPKRSKSSSMDEFRELWGEGDGADGDGGDERYDKLAEGKNSRNILPNKDPDEPFFADFAMHFNVGPDKEDKFRCIEPGGPFGHSKKKDKQRAYRAKLCPGCKKYCNNKTASRKFEFGSKEGKKFWGEKVAPWRAKHRFVCATNRPKSKADKNKVFVLEIGPMIAKPLIEMLYDEDSGGDFTDPRTGRLVKIQKTQLSKRSQDVEYKTTVMPDRRKILNWKKLKKQLPDLASFLPPMLDVEAIQAILDGEGRDEDDDAPRSKKSGKGSKRDRDDDDEDFDDDDDDEDTDRHAGRLAKRKRGNDEDVDPDADEDDDEEDEAPKKKSKGKKSKLRSKLAKKAGKDDDDDDEDEDDEDLDDEEEDDDDSEDDDDD